MRPPPDLSHKMETHLDPKYTAWFKSPIASLLSFIPLKLFTAFAVYSNMYAHTVMDSAGNNLISGARWTHDITLQEMMAFLGILLKMVLRPMTGKSYTKCWSDKRWHPYTSAMELRRFQQIRSVLHFNDNSKIPKMQR
jgi:beta-lactamase regulating signal transducer with metallopeptidase domain